MPTGGGGEKPKQPSPPLPTYRAAPPLATVHPITPYSPFKSHAHSHLHLSKARVHHVVDAVNGERSLRDIGGHHTPGRDQEGEVIGDG